MCGGFVPHIASDFPPSLRKHVPVDTLRWSFWVICQRRHPQQQQKSIRQQYAEETPGQRAKLWQAGCYSWSNCSDELVFLQRTDTPCSRCLGHINLTVWQVSLNWSQSGFEFAWPWQRPSASSVTGENWHYRNAPEPTEGWMPAAAGLSELLDTSYFQCFCLWRLPAFWLSDGTGSSET